MPPSTTKLHKFEGREVIATRIALKNAGDGLSNALAIDPQELRIGAEVYVVCKCTVGPISFDPIKETDSLVRKQSLIVGTATLVEKELVADVIAAQELKLEEARGVTRLDFEDGDLDAQP